MATKRNTFKQKKQKKEKQKFNFKSLYSFKWDWNRLNDRRFQMSFGLLLLLFSFFLFLSLISYIFTGQADQSVIENTGLGNLILSGKEVRNWLGLTGAGLAHFFIYDLFGIASVLMLPLIFSSGYNFTFRKNLLPLKRTGIFIFFMMFWFSLLMGYFVENAEGSNASFFLCGAIGYEIAILFSSLVGWGTMFFLMFSMGVFLIYFFKEGTLDKIKSVFKNQLDSIKAETEGKEEIDSDIVEETSEEESETANEEEASWEVTPSKKRKQAVNKDDLELTVDDKLEEHDAAIGHPQTTLPQVENPSNITNAELPPSQEVKVLEAGNQPVTPSLSVGNVPPIKEGEQLKIDDFDEYDPTLDLGAYKLPDMELLNEHAQKRVKVTRDELEENKDKIIETLSNFKVGISSIKATIGPTVTLYEIVPEAGIKISRIRNLEDDIALNLAALGIRIIAPIPGKGTIGIEVPNKHRNMVPIRSVLETEEFKNSNKELPIALGKTISDEVFVTDLSKMPHLLMAGATGQGKSVGLNVVLSSLLYSKHPSELKFVLVDPKKVELTLFNKIERHYLATLPDAEDPIVTDTRKVVTVLNSLCVEMDMRYNLLKDAGTRNLKEYNSKFIKRKLNPEKGHRFLPYIVLVIDELADLMMVAGKEVEMPIARLAQLARAIGIHLVIATQRPSVDVITGIIKANFPARLSFRVTSKIDSRTILDTGGAEQLIGMGDMLLSNGSEIIRLQCAFVDTDEVERICEFVGSQRGYETAYLLPEYEDDNTETKMVDLDKRDVKFEEAARLLILHQQGSTSLIQRKLSLGYNRAGRIIDQLEAAGIVGPFEGSKARQVLIQDEYALEQLLNSMNNS